MAFWGNKSGFTIVELLVVIAFMSLVVVVTTPSLQNWLEQRSLDQYTIEAQDVLRRAFSDAVRGKNNEAFGVHFESDRFVLFEGSTYNPGDNKNEVHELRGTIQVSDIGFANGEPDIIFAAGSGLPDTNGTVTFQYRSGDTRTISVNQLGLVERL